MKVIAHRGGAGDNTSLENGLKAIRAALKLGVDEIEIDVRVGPGQISGIPVLKHDPLLAEDTKLATLEEVIKLVNRKIPLCIEVKPDEPIDPVIGVVARYLENGWQPSNFRWASFSQNTLRELHTAMPDIETVVNERWSSVRAVWRARQLGTKRISMNARWLWPGVINSLARRGYKLSAYVLNDTAKASSWERFGLYGAITDYPERFKK